MRDLEDAGRQEEATQRDYAGRYPIELLQNAHDASADAGVRGTVAYYVRRNALIVANQGKGFDARRIRSLVRQGSSEKAERSRKRTIGYKGVGFSAVFELSRTPQIICSSRLAFGFDREQARNLVEQRLKKRPKIVAARNFPFSLDSGAWAEDAELVDELFARGFVTVLRLPFRRGQSQARVTELLEEQLAPETLVFLPWTRRLEVHDSSGSASWETSSGVRVGVGRVVHVDDHAGDRQSWLAHHGTAPVTREQVNALDDPAWEGVAELRATVALPWANRTITPGAVAEPVHVYFPTAETTGRSCLIHGDFYVDSGRSHIFDHGAAGTLNEILAERIALLTADLAESVAPRHAPGLFAALAEAGTPSAFGKVLNRHITQRLSTARIVRPADGGGPRIGADTSFISSVSKETDVLLMDLMTKRGDLVRVKDYAARGAIGFLESIGVAALGETDTARRVSLAQSKVPYEKALGFLSDWVEETHHAEALLKALADRRIVKDVEGKWCRPREAVLSIEGVPPLPERLRRRELAPIRSERAKELLDHLDVDALGPAQALAIFNAALDVKSFGQTDDETRELHDWLLALFRKAPDALKSNRLLKGRAPVLAMPAGGSDVGWEYASRVYFGREWSDVGEHMEILYGTDGRRRFLAGSPGSDRNLLIRFYEALGVRRLPRRYSIAPPHAADQWKWRGSEQVRDQAYCPKDHPNTHQELRCFVLDRLDPIVQHAQSDQRVAEAVAAVLAAHDAPYGKDATYTCTHTRHRGKAPLRSVPNYQRWRLRQSAWLPVTGDPAGRVRRAPTEVWTGIPKSQRGLLLPRPAMKATPRSFELVSWDQPPVEAVERALADLKAAHEDLAEAPEPARETAAVLLQKLESSLGSDDIRTTIALPGTQDGRPRWVTDGVVVDLPGLDDVPGLAVVAVSPTSKIRGAYKLAGAHERLSQRVHPGADAERTPVLSRDRKAQLVALLKRWGVSARKLAERLNALRERQVERIDVEIALDDGGLYMLCDLPFKLVAEAEPPTLYVNDPNGSHTVGLARVLADYLKVAQHADRLALAMLAPDELVQGLRRSEIEEALELLDGEDDEEAIDGHSPDVDQAATSEPADGANDQPITDTRQAGGGLTDADRRSADAASSTASTGTASAAGSSRDRDSTRVSPTTSRASSAEASAAGGNAASRVSPPRQPARGGGRSASPPGSAAGRDPGNRDTRSADRPPLPDPGLVQFGPPRPARFDTDDSDPSQHTDEQANGEGGSDRPDVHGSRPQRTRPRPDDHSERDAIRYVCEYARRILGVATIRDRQKDRCGWDLDFVYTGGHEERVEVKGSTGFGPFEITRNELRKSRDHDNYVLYFLAGQASSEPVLYRFDDFGARVDDHQHLRAASWSVIGWRELRPVAIPVDLSSG